MTEDGRRMTEDGRQIFEFGSRNAEVGIRQSAWSIVEGQMTHFGFSSLGLCPSGCDLTRRRGEQKIEEK
jgi:hypothetical protein